MARFRIPVALVALLVWMAIILWGTWNPHDPTSLTSTITDSVSWQIVGAGGFLPVLVIVMGWRDIGFAAPRPWGSLKVLAVPALYLVLFAAVALFIGLPAPGVILFLAINTLAVGFSEELMFRGVLFRAFRSRLALWPAVWLTTTLFGSVHVFNALTTGDWLSAAIQAVTAGMSGIFFLAVVLRTHSIIPSMLYHACWDFLLTTTAAGSPAAGSVEPAQNWTLMLLPFILILPNFVYGVFLLRKVWREENGGADAGPAVVRSEMG